MSGGSTTYRPCTAGWLLRAALLVAAGCGAGTAARPATAEPDVAHSVLADDDGFKPAYDKSELRDALIAERGVEVALAHQVSELEARQADGELRRAVADLGVRRRFIATLEICEAEARWCPPRLDDPAWAFDPDPDLPADPPMTATLRFDIASWRVLAAELHGRACACRTIACVDTVGVAVDQLESRPMPQVQGDETASTSVTLARECLFRLRGKSVVRLVPRAVE